jgi:glyoxylase-like metal-dependent hydrolase (beta-lactamase superfamily II)
MSGLRVASSWFERSAIGGGVTLLTEPHVHPLLRCNIWHVRGRDRDLVVDTGLGVASLTAAAADLFGGPVLAVATHAHMDHAGGLHEFESRAIHHAEAEALAGAEGNLPLDVSWYDDDTLEALARMGYDIRAGLLTEVPCQEFSMAGHHLVGAAATILLAEGDIVDLGNRKFEVLHLPGHSPGSIGLLERASQTLFSGDAIYDGPLLDEIPGSDIGSYVATMHRLRTSPVETVHAGHGPSMGRARFLELVDAYLVRRENS